jgi:hypothetical protein
MKLKDILEFPRSQGYVFHPDLSLEECVNKLTDTVVEHKRFLGLSSNELFGMVTADKFIVEWRGYQVKAFCFCGRLSRVGTGTDISGYFGFSLFFKFFIFFMGVIFIVIFPVFSTIIIAFGIIYLLESGIIDNDILSFIKTTLNAEQIRPPPIETKPKLPVNIPDLDENFVFYSRCDPRRQR